MGALDREELPKPGGAGEKPRVDAHPLLIRRGSPRTTTGQLVSPFISERSSSMSRSGSTGFVKW